MNLTELNEASYHGPKAITKDSEIRYAVVDEDGVYFSESPGEGLAGAKLWKSERGARELAAEWGFAMRPRPKNKIVKVEIQTMMRRVD